MSEHEILTPEFWDSEPTKQQIEENIWYFSNNSMYGIDTQNENNGNTALHYAVKKNRIDVIRFILDKSANPNIPNKAGDTQIILALKDGLLNDIFKLMFENLKEEPYRDINGNSILHIAVRSANVRLFTVQKIVNKYPDLKNAQNNNGETPVHVVSDRGTRYVDIINEIITDNNIIELNNDGDTPLQVAINKKRNDVIKRILNSKCILTYVNNAENITEQESLIIFEHCYKYNTTDDIVLNLIRRNDFNAAQINEKGDTPLHVACRYRRIKIVKSLLDKDDTILNIKNNDGDTPLHIAIKNRQQDIVALILNGNYNFDVNIQDKEGRTATFLIKHYKFDENTIKNLEASKANVHTASNSYTNINNSNKENISEIQSPENAEDNFQVSQSLSDRIKALGGQENDSKIAIEFNDDILKDFKTERDKYQNKSDKFLTIFYWGSCTLGIIFLVIILWNIAFPNVFNITNYIEVISLHLILGFIMFINYRGYIRNQLVADYFNHKSTTIKIALAIKASSQDKGEDLIIHSAKDNPLDVLQKGKNGELDADHMVQLITSIQNALKNITHQAPAQQPAPTHTQQGNGNQNNHG